jgi:hypothetical protein
MTAIARTSDLLEEVANGERTDDVHIDELLAHFGQRSFGGLLLIAVVPALLPVPFGVGAISGPLISLIGLQLLLVRPQPWLPGFIRRRGLKRDRFRRFTKRITPLLLRFERVSGPRLEVLTTHFAASMFTGLLLILLGFLLSLPIPFSNYPFGLLILTFAFALIERDGALLLAAWTIGAGACIASALMSREVIDLLGRLFG